MHTETGLSQRGGPLFLSHVRAETCEKSKATKLESACKHVRSLEDVTVCGTLSSDCGALLLVAVVRRIAEQQESLIEQDTRASLFSLWLKIRDIGLAP